MMNDPSERPSKRARILSSINPYQTDGPQPPQSASPASPKRTQPQKPQPSDRPSRDAEAEAGEQSSKSGMNDSYSSTRPSKFRFKDPARKKDRRDRESDHTSDRHHRSRRHRGDEDDERHRSRRHRHDHGEEAGEDERSSRSHRHRHRRRQRDKEEAPPDPEPEDPFAGPPLDPDAAFRESLFDAMADDEGAAYWEGVYGQPIHTLGGGAGELESMTEDEYAAHIRAKMWEKTHAGLLEARERKRRERAERDEERARDRRARDDAGRVDDAVEARLRRGRDRRLRREWRERWARYCDAWARWDKGLAEDEALGLLAGGGDAWPVESGRRADVDSAGVKAFFTQCLDAVAEEKAGGKAASSSSAGGDVAARLKEERVRWHPDKIQQRLGGRVDEDLGRDVTAVFQIVDNLWSEMRGKK
ncbi:hypothetical protein MCOR27_002506 [Pyricularia oryzae]|uniref:Uncharacterized protein n=2 Tax=Pyricularia TaxID=48558 RepID=A0ABQ8NB20_PYRGI|nr:hypothetical protein MCOR01_001291 [Pyricularia oryzae]KAI6294241.1 hypothetical protein MCOR33_008581 [Pyricularia grisea]KAH9430162.1 hypothetical protein MCOR02_009885 [Pyricularia oryzae]KAI6263298.1 hypothetical protein MCOR19_000424 [Pyricularia oryzae]KAI6277106.1 hypothetical protein MCOR26_005308 [Pyricularia oryzae]